MADLSVAYVLVCLAGQSSDALDARDVPCTRANAYDVIYAEPAVVCGIFGQAALAGTLIGKGLRDGEWVMTVCPRPKT